MKIKNKIQKLALTATILFASLPAYSLSNAGIVGVSLGSAAAVALTAGLIHRKHKREREENNTKSRPQKKMKYEDSGASMKSEFSQSKKSMKKDLKQHKSELCKHKTELKKSKNKDKKEAKRNNQPVKASAETMQHQSKIQELETMIDNLERRIENAL